MKKNLLFILFMIGVLMSYSKSDLNDHGTIKKESVRNTPSIFIAAIENLQVQKNKLLTYGLQVDSAQCRINFRNKNQAIVAFIDSNRLTITYPGFGGDIETISDNTVTIMGRYNDTVNGYGTKIFLQTPYKLFETGINLNGMNLFNPIDWTWQDNKDWVIQSAERGDIIRFISDPTDMRNIYRNGVDGERTAMGLEVAVLDSLGFVWQSSHYRFIKANPME